MRLPAPSLPLLCLLVLALAGCGDGDSGGAAADGGADPASVMPRSSVVYVEGVVRPEGEQEDHVRELLSTALRTDDPGARIKALIDDGFRDEGQGQTFDRDIDPWLGDRVGVTVTNLAATEAGYILAIATRDAGKAAAFLASEARADGSEQRSHKGSKYFVERDGTASGVVEDFVVLADREADFRRAVDTSKAEGLDDVERFDDALDELPEDRLGTLYVDPQLLGDAAAAGAEDETAAGVIRSAVEGIRAVTAFAQASPDSATVEARTVIAEEGAGAEVAALGAGAAPDLVQSLPEDAWVAIGLGRVGDTLRTGLESVAGGLGSAVIAGQVRQRTGIDPERDVLSWIGDVAVFTRGDSLAQLGGGLVIEATDEAAAGRALPRLVQAAGRAAGVRFEDLRMAGADQAWVAAVPGAPAPVVLARSGDRVVLALGDDAAADALDPPGTLGDTPIYDRAETALDGVEPTMVIDGRAALKVFGEAGAGDPDFAVARPYLELLDLLAAGSEKDGDTLRHRLTAKSR